ncbi:MAG: hypothetical protein IKD04_02355 [Clostridia bacterium]|nr:hypothetical protein [Clostridia bacterium]
MMIKQHRGQSPVLCFEKGEGMRYNNKLLFSLKEKYIINQIAINNDMYSLFSFGKEKNNNYIILKNDICAEGELSDVVKFIDGLSEKEISKASFVFIAFVKNDFKKDDYILFNGMSFLHTISYNFTTSQYVYNKNFYYLGSRKIKQLFTDVEQIVFD